MLLLLQHTSNVSLQSLQGSQQLILLRQSTHSTQHPRVAAAAAVATHGRSSSTRQQQPVQRHLTHPHSRHLQRRCKQTGSILQMQKAVLLVLLLSTAAASKEGRPNCAQVSQADTHR